MRSEIGGRRFEVVMQIDRSIERCRLDLRFHDVVRVRDRAIPKGVFVSLSYRFCQVDTLTILR